MPYLFEFKCDNYHHSKKKKNLSPLDWRKCSTTLISFKITVLLKNKNMPLSSLFHKPLLEVLLETF